MKTLRIILIILAIGLLGFFLVYAQTAVNGAVFFIQEIRSHTYSRLSFVGLFVSKIKNQKTLIEENIRLEAENYSLLSHLARESDVEDQNNFLRQALNLSNSTGLEFLDAGVFNSQFNPEGYHFLINKGSRYGINNNDVVITSSGILLGVVEETFENYSKISLIMNPDFKTTIRVLSKDIMGIAMGAIDGSLDLDFISQNDEIMEGDIIVTSGIDILPSGLIIGKVTQVSSSGGDLFKKIKVEPFLKNINLSRVLVLKK